jgi:hypothetical protein
MLCAFFRGKRLKDITPMLIESFRRQRLSEKTQEESPSTKGFT